MAGSRDHADNFDSCSRNRRHGPLARVKLDSMNLPQNQIFLIPKDVLFQEVGGETVLLDLDSERYFGLDAVGTRVWALINEGMVLGEVINTLLEEYEVDRVTLESDVEALLESLREAGLITPDATEFPAGKD